MDVWNFEAAQITDKQDVESRPIYLTPAIKEFLRFQDQRTQLRVISGLKGTGKTLFLKLISHYYRHHLGGVILIPAGALTERLGSIDYDFSSEKAKAWASHERWAYVWRTVLSTVILKAVGHELPAQLMKVFPDTLKLSIGAHLSAAIRTRAANTADFQEFYQSMLDAPIQGISTPVALFLDNIDEALGRHVGYDLYCSQSGSQPQSGTHSYDLWVAAQLGFVSAARELTSRNAHLKLYGTVRAEAIRGNRMATAFNAQAMILDLTYTPDELRGIFVTKLKQLRETSPESFVQTIAEEPDPVKAFLPFLRLEHPTVTYPNGDRFTEDAFCYLRRHTRGRPRELDYIGQEIQAIVPNQRTPDGIREVIGHLSRLFFKFARNEAVPFWDPSLDRLLEELPSNFIPRSEALGIAEQHFGKDRAIASWKALSASGLCGIVVPAQPSGTVQRFANHDRLADITVSEFEAAHTWIIHPCATIAKRALRRRYRPNARNVAGHAYPYVRGTAAPAKHLHVLIGAGKLGLGLVVPKLLGNKSTRLLVVARDPVKWAPLLDRTPDAKTFIEIVCPPGPGHASRGEKVPIKLVVDTNTEWQKAVRAALRSCRCVLLVSSDVTSLQWAVRLADSIGTSVGPRGIKDVARNIADAHGRARLVLAYENDAAEVNEAAAFLQSKGLTLVPTVVDRICAEREIQAGIVTVRAEEHGRITAFADCKDYRLLPPAFREKENTAVRVVDDEKEFLYIRDVKLRLVNSLHAAAAALVLTALAAAGAKEETADDHVLGLIAGRMEIWDKLVALKDVMVLSVLGTLPSDSLRGPELTNRITELNAHGKQTLERMMGEPDSPNRVLRRDIRSLLAKHERLFADVEELALHALSNDRIRALLPLTEEVVHARLGALHGAFLKLMNRVEKKG